MGDLTRIGRENEGLKEGLRDSLLAKFHFLQFSFLAGTNRLDLKWLHTPKSIISAKCDAIEAFITQKNFCSNRDNQPLVQIGRLYNQLHMLRRATSKGTIKDKLYRKRLGALFL
jgi:hypothetical protein